MKAFNHIQKPTIIVNKLQVMKNITIMADKAESCGARFRPHFKTHQSAHIGEWFRNCGVEAITVSSVDMAEYFAGQGWEDILIAFPVNIREIDHLFKLSTQTKLGLLVDHVRQAEALINFRKAIQADVWIELDTGMNRSGVNWRDHGKLEEIAETIIRSECLNLKGLLTHAGQTYHAESTEMIRSLFKESVNRITNSHKYLQEKYDQSFEISVGDTPGCWLCEEFDTASEIRPGNFIFFDAMMYSLGVCRAEDIALSVACPVVSKYRSRNEVLIYGGSVHLSKEVIENSNPQNFGFVVTTADNHQWKLEKTNIVRSLSQEHGVVKLAPKTFKNIEIGDLLYIIPVHSCLVVSLLGEYTSTDGELIEAKISV